MSKATTKPKRRGAGDTIRYLVSRSGSRGRGGTDFVIEIPADWRITFGAVNPGSQMSRADGLHCLRIWEGEKLRAVYSDVTGFRDLSIPMAVKVEKETGAASWEQDSQGNFAESKQITRDSSFVEDDAEVPF